MGYSSFRDSANALFPLSPSYGSQLAVKNATSNSWISFALSRSELHSAVQPPVNALGNQAMTTACLPLNWARLYSLPSEPFNLKSGALSPALMPSPYAWAARVKIRLAASAAKINFMMFSYGLSQTTDCIHDHCKDG